MVCLNIKKIIRLLSSTDLNRKKQELLDLFKHTELLKKNLNNVDNSTNNDLPIKKSWTKLEI